MQATIESRNSRPDTVFRQAFRGNPGRLFFYNNILWDVFSCFENTEFSIFAAIFPSLVIASGCVILYSGMDERPLSGPLGMPGEESPNSIGQDAG